jgi:zinc transporter 9
MTRLTGNPLWDAIGSIIIGLMLAIVAVLLINKNREVLISKCMPEELKELVMEVLENDPAIEKVIDFKSSMLDVGTYRVKCEVEFNGNSLLRELYRRDKDFLKDEYEYIKEDYQEFLKFCADYTDRIPRLIGGHIDVLETNIRLAVPEAKYIDIEIN